MFSSFMSEMHRLLTSTPAELFMPRGHNQMFPFWGRMQTKVSRKMRRPLPPLHNTHLAFVVLFPELGYNHRRVHTRIFRQGVRNDLKSFRKGLGTVLMQIDL